MSNNPQEYPIPKDAYVNFDGDTIKEAIRQRLNQTGTFTDQNYEGSNLSHFNEIIAYSFSMLMFYLNKQSNEGMFTEAQLYENVSKIVKQLDYKPIGYQTATLSFEATAQNLDKGLYRIPRYSYIPAGGVVYSFNEDIVFSKSTDLTAEVLTDMSRENLLYQGSYVEHPIIRANGSENEVLYLTTGLNIDHFNIDVYVKDANTGNWTQWERTPSLYINRANEYKYELRLNESKVYELKFGNDINGKKLNPNDQVAIYYLHTGGSSGEVGANVLNGKQLVFWESTRLNQILPDVREETITTSFSPQNKLTFTNSRGSSFSSTPESVESIKENAPGVFRSQFRVVTSNDYEVFVKTNFSNLIQDVSVQNNSEYLNYYLKYFSDLGLLDSNLESRALFNQVNYSDSCNFNNVYLFVVPKTVKGALGYLNPAQKELIIDSLREEKVLTSETIIMDPVYLAFDIALGDNNETTISDRSLSKILIEKSKNSKRTDSSLKQDVSNIITSYFSRDNLKLGQTIDLNQLSADILSINGVKKIFTYREDTESSVEGLRFISWNPAYGDASLENVVTNITLEDFQFPFLAEDIDFTSKIIVESSNTKFEGVEY